jgi:hypothetical protein
VYLPTTIDLRLLTVLDRGLPNKERVVFRSYAAVNLQNYIVGLGVTTDDVLVTPLSGYIYYFEDVVVPAQSWIIVYTGSGQKQVSTMPEPHEIAFTYHWGSPSVLFTEPGVVPILFRVSEMNFPDRPPHALKAPAAHNVPALR